MPGFCLDQPQKMNGSALSQSGRMGPPNYREQRTGVYDGLHIRREGGRARADSEGGRARAVSEVIRINNNT